MNRIRRSIALAALMCLTALISAASAAPPRFEITIAPTLRGPFTGRLVLIVAKNGQPEPRFTVGPSGPALFGIDIEGATPGQTLVLDERALGYPMRLGQLPAGEYFVQ